MTSQDQNRRESGGGIGKALGIAASVIALLGFFGIAKYTDLFSTNKPVDTTTTFSR